MREFILQNINHFLCGLLLISRLGDIISTFLVSPKLQLEANPIMKRLGWKFGILTVFACLVPYVSTPAALMMLVPFLMVSASNIGKIWFVRCYGETEYAELIRSVARGRSPWPSLAGTWASSAFIALQGGVLLFFYPGVQEWGYWFAMGILLYAFIVALWGSVFTLRLFKKANQEAETEETSTAS